jgi:hypothetical protein
MCFIYFSHKTKFNTMGTHKTTLNLLCCCLCICCSIIRVLDMNIYHASFPLQYAVQHNCSNVDSLLLSNVRHIRISKTLKHGNNCILELRKYGISSTENRIYGYATCNLYRRLTVSTSLVQAATNIKTNEGSKASKITAGGL